MCAIAAGCPAYRSPAGFAGSTSRCHRQLARFLRTRALYPYRILLHVNSGWGNGAWAEESSRRGSGGRHRLVAERRTWGSAVRLPGANDIGRVGALAVALGIGGAIAALPATGLRHRGADDGHEGLHGSRPSAGDAARAGRPPGSSAAASSGRTARSSDNPSGAASAKPSGRRAQVQTSTTPSPILDDTVVSTDPVVVKADSPGSNAPADSGPAASSGVERA